MNRSSEPGEGAQYSVAELLARYGDAAPSTGRRRRRAPEDEYYTAPQSIIERVRTADSGPVPALDRPRRRRSADADLETREPSWTEFDDRAPGRSEPNGHRRADFDERNWELDHLGRTGLDERSWAELDGGGPGPAAFDGRGRTGRDSYAPPGGLDGPGRGASWTGAGADENTWLNLPHAGTGPQLGTEPQFGTEPQALNGRALTGDSRTEQLPRVDPAPLDLPPRDPAPVAQTVEDIVEPDPVFPSAHWLRDGEPPAGLSDSTQLVAQPDGRDWADDDAGPAWNGDLHTHHDVELPDVGPDEDETAVARVLDLETEDDPEPGEFRSPVREWAMMATQIGIGVVGGAVLWLICEWLWQRIPVVALVVALAVITGLVWVVRHVRRAEDLQTTVIAVLVGLFVTVSPAALLLVGR